MNQVHFNALDLNLLRVLDTLLEERSVTRAGARLALTPSAVSHALGRLRHLLDDELFVRGADGMQPTARAAEIGPHVRHALMEIQTAVTAEAFDPRTTEREFTIGANEYIATALLPGVIDRLRDEAPNAALRVRSLIDVDIVEELDAGRIDLVLSSFRRIPERFAHQPLYRDDGVWVMRADHPTARHPLTEKRIASLAHLIPTIANDATDTVGGFISQHGLELRAGIAEAMAQEIGIGRGAVMLPHLLAVPTMLIQSDMIAFLPRRLAMIFARSHPLVLREPLKPGTLIEVSALWHGRLGARADIVWLRSLVLDAALRLEPASGAAPAEVAPTPRRTGT
jgi:DNA-binding transcriptional LysR family regulator